MAKLPVPGLPLSDPGMHVTGTETSSFTPITIDPTVAGHGAMGAIVKDDLHDVIAEPGFDNVRIEVATATCSDQQQDRKQDFPHRQIFHRTYPTDAPTTTLMVIQNSQGDREGSGCPSICQVGRPHCSGMGHPYMDCEDAGGPQFRRAATLVAKLICLPAELTGNNAVPMPMVCRFETELGPSHPLPMWRPVDM